MPKFPFYRSSDSQYVQKEHKPPCFFEIKDSCYIPKDIASCTFMQSFMEYFFHTLKIANQSSCLICGKICATPEKH